MPTSTRNYLSIGLVAVQFAAIGAFLSLARAANWSAWPVACLALAATIGVAALLANRPGNFNVRPDPKAGGKLIRHGVYRWIRHPMYTSLLLAGIAVVWAAPTPPAIVVWMALLVTLITKAHLEERWLKAVHDQYAEYMQHTKRFVPWVW